jgi:threonine dehydrogenase-like Zn-dependent dehydrogenase
VKQLAQKLKDGKPQVLDVPTPVVGQGTVLVRNAYSVISAGTEGSTVRAARKTLIGKAQERPQQARQMLDLLKQSGPVQAYRTLSKKLDSYSPLGYSSAGVVVAIGQRVSGVSVGDKVACAGTTASHSELIAVPENLCVTLSPDADLKQAAYNTLGAIAMQGIRQADLRLGETCAVIGLGLLGQLTCLLLRAGGIRVIGMDIDQEMVTLARLHAADLAADRSEPGLEQRISEFTDGIGPDAVIITAATPSLDPVNFAGQILRQKGRVVIVGNVPTGFDREPNYYRKELDLRMSCSYGPGRYDPAYEERGLDYPVAYVRWTERRNMQAFQELLRTGKVDVSYLTSHVFKLADAAQAYDLVLEGSQPFVGLLIEYDDVPVSNPRIQLRQSLRSPAPSEVSLAFVGAGSYAMSHLLPNIPNESWVRRATVMTSSGLSARSVAERFKFEDCTSDERDVFENDRANTVFIATRHNSHAKYVLKALAAHKRVFVEKPLCITEQELSSIEKLVEETTPQPLLMVGFNRRFSPLTRFVREAMGAGPMSMIYRINAGDIPRDSWIQDPDVGGGRIIGEGCHFIDLLTFLNGSLPVRVQAFGMPATAGQSDTVTINLLFQNGSVGTIGYC